MKMLDRNLSFAYGDVERRAMEAEVKRLEEQSPGVEVSLGAAVRSLIRQAARINQKPTIRRVT